VTPEAADRPVTGSTNHPLVKATMVFLMSHVVLMLVVVTLG
jgi:hypothetical protein